MFRFRLIDFSRSIAALIVAMVHWDGFMIEVDWGGYQRGGLVPPLRDLLAPIYAYGDFAVQYFWMISGFIFAHVYGDSRIGFGEFAGRRIARLYPLHLFTLVLVAMLQTVLVLMISTTLFYGNNDVYHFFLNLFFISSWGLENGLSFNGPIWSVSVEILIYILFWLCVRVMPLNAIFAFVVAVIFFLLQDMATFTHIDYCGMLFFMGVAVFYVARQFTAQQLAFLSVLTWVAGLALILVVPKLAQSLTLLTVVGFGPLLGLLAAFDRMSVGRTGVLDRMAAFGDLSYGIYLLHVPVIMVITIVMIALGIERSHLSEALLPMIGYLVLAIWLAHLSLKWIETPAQTWLRQVLRPATARPDT